MPRWEALTLLAVAACVLFLFSLVRSADLTDREQTRRVRDLRHRRARIKRALDRDPR